MLRTGLAFVTVAALLVAACGAGGSGGGNVAGVVSDGSEIPSSQSTTTATVNDGSVTSPTASSAASPTDSSVEPGEVIVGGVALLSQRLRDSTPGATFVTMTALASGRVEVRGSCVVLMSGAGAEYLVLMPAASVLVDDVVFFDADHSLELGFWEVTGGLVSYEQVAAYTDSDIPAECLSFDEVFLAGNESRWFQLSPDVGFPLASAGGFVWTVVGVDRGDRLNVRREPDPGSPVVGTLGQWVTGVDVDGEVVTGVSGSWRRVTVSGVQGWVNARFLVAQPASALTDAESVNLADIASMFVASALDPSVSPVDRLGERGVWVGGLGIYADGPTVWNWVPSSELTEPDDWSRVRTFNLISSESGCGPDCDMSLIEFLQFGSLDSRYNVEVDDIPLEARGYWDGLVWEAPETLHRVVLDKPASSEIGMDWQRIHLIYDWSTGRPLVAAINTHGWTP